MNATASISFSNHNTPEPQIIISGPEHYRVLHAQALALAAKAELATAAIEAWSVQVEDDRVCRVYLELSRGTPAEASRGLAMLKTLI